MLKEMTDLERVKKVINWYIFQGIGQNNTEIATKLGYTKSSLSQIMGGKVPLSDKFLEKLSSLDENINFVWLKNGEGSMFRNTSKEREPKENTHTRIIEQTNDTSIGIPLIPLDALAGLPATDNIGVAFIDCEHYIVPEFQSKGVEFMIRVSGSSMYPKYSNGDLLACRRITDILFFQWGKIYVIDSSQGVLVKRVFEDTNPDNILLVSDNKEKYPPFSFPKSDIRSLSIVLGVIRLE